MLQQFLPVIHGGLLKGLPGWFWWKFQVFCGGGIQQMAFDGFPKGCPHQHTGNLRRANLVPPSFPDDLLQVEFGNLVQTDMPQCIQYLPQMGLLAQKRILVSAPPKPPLRPAPYLYACRTGGAGLYRQRRCKALKGTSGGYGKSRGPWGYGLLARNLTNKFSTGLRFYHPCAKL